nr:MAG TPA: hypothetical protein [Caudoviricetes sp.]
MKSASQPERAANFYVFFPYPPKLEKHGENTFVRMKAKILYRESEIERRFM